MEQIEYMEQTEASEALILAAAIGDIKGMAEALRNGADINTIGRKELDQTPLQVALSQDQEEAALFLLNKSSININITNRRGETALHIAAQHRHLNAIKILIYLGANVNAQDRKGNAPLHAAINGDRSYEYITDTPDTAYEKVIKKLLKVGADVSIRNKDNKTPQEYAVQLAAQGYPYAQFIAQLLKNMNFSITIQTQIKQLRTNSKR